MENKLKEAVEILCEELRNDESYYMTWKANIAMAFKDAINMNMLDGNGNRGTWLNYFDLHVSANKAADNFLKLLINK